MIKFGSDFSGIGAADQALMRLNIEYKTVFACDMDKFARQSFIENYGETNYYPEDVGEREIPEEPLDIYVSSPPCQAFSIAGKKLGKLDKRGILFFNSHEFIQKNKPRFFVFENVKGLLSDDSGRTFNEWISMLGGKTVNGNQVFFPHEDSVPYHVYWKVLNATDFNVPQNRERVFIVGIRDDQDNNFEWPKDIPLTLKVADILEENVDSKYYLRDAAIARLLRKESFVPKINPEIAGTLNTKNNSPALSMDNGTTLIVTNNKGELKIPQRNEVCPTISSNSWNQNNLLINSGVSKGYEVAEPGDCISIDFPESKTRKGRVQKGKSQTIDTGSRIGYYDGVTIRRLTPRECMRLMDFPDTYRIVVSDSQAYKQAGNSIVVACLASIINILSTKCNLTTV